LDLKKKKRTDQYGQGTQTLHDMVVWLTMDFIPSSDQ
jgi:hypothetical protein